MSKQCEIFLLVLKIASIDAIKYKDAISADLIEDGNTTELNAKKI